MAKRVHRTGDHRISAAILLAVLLSACMSEVSVESVDRASQRTDETEEATNSEPTPPGPAPGPGTQQAGFVLERGAGNGKFPARIIVKARHGGDLTKLSTANFLVTGAAAPLIELGDVVNDTRELRIYPAELSAEIAVSMVDAKQMLGEPVVVAARDVPGDRIKVVKSLPVGMTSVTGGHEVTGYLAPYMVQVTFELTNDYKVEQDQLTLDLGDGLVRLASDADCGAALAPAATCKIVFGMTQAQLSDKVTTGSLEVHGELLETLSVTLKATGLADVWLDPNDVATVFADSACSVPVDGNVASSAAACIKNKGSTSGLNFSQATAANTPVLRTSEGFTGRRILFFDGNDLLSSNADVRTAVGDVHFMGLFHRQTASVVPSWERIISGCWWGGASNDGDQPCFSMAVPFGYTNGGVGWDTNLGALSSPTQKVLVENYSNGSFLRALALGHNTVFTCCEHLTGEIGEIVLTGTKLRTAQMEAIRAYLKTRWNWEHHFSHVPNYSEPP